MRQPQKNLFQLPMADLDEILRDLENEWDALRGRHLFISGGTGFFGKWLLGALAHANTELGLRLGVRILSRDPAAFLEQYPEARHASFSFQEGAVETFEDVTRTYDFVLHAATATLGIATPEQENGRSRTITQGTERMVKLARRNGARLLNISSGGIYGAAAGTTSGAREDDAAAPITNYSRSKWVAEQFCAVSEVDFVTARAFAFLGPHLPLDAHYAAGNFLRDARGGGPVRVRGDGTALRSYLYPTDLVVWLLRILLHGKTGRAYNVGSDEIVSTAELARKIATAVSSQPEVIIEAAQTNGPQHIYLPNIGRARAELGLDVRVPLDEAIHRSSEWLATMSP